jgi:hypothetical protein
MQMSPLQPPTRAHFSLPSLEHRLLQQRLARSSTIDTLVSVHQLVIESASRSLTTQLFILFFEGGVGEQEAASKWFNAFGGSWWC